MTMTTRPKVPRGLYGDEHEGVLDPERISARERMTSSLTRSLEERDRRASPSPLVRRLQAATDKAFRKATR
jgi:hypothetical protein